MAEAAGLAIAGNIIQFVDLGIKLFKGGRQLYRSTEGASTEALELETVTLALRSYAQALRASKPSQIGLKGDLEDLTRHCEALATELLALLEELKVKDTEHRKWKSFKVAIASIVKQKDVAELEKRLNRLQALTTQSILNDLSQQQPALLSSVRSLREQNLALEANTTSKLDDIISQLQVQAKSKRLAEIGDSLMELAEEGEAVGKQQRLLRRLHFNSIKVRQDAVKPAHAETFKWIFESSHTNFRKWLRSGKGVYWIEGKAGSGKSTLMKFTSTHPLTSSDLQDWARGRKLITGSHFFWNSGSSLQKSEEGLLRTLLCQIFKECPYLIGSIWPDSEAFGQDWNIQSLRAAIEAISQVPLLTEHLCFFIDGLDEYSGRHQDLISTIKGLASSPSIKVCASSRPWNVFNDAFGRTTNKLKLEDLTRDDIKTYVAKNLQEDANFKEREPLNPLLNNIAEEVSKRAQGVFLWVFLVVESLKKGLMDGAKLHEMRQMLDSLPSDLEEYFQHMIESIEESYRQESVRIFRVATEALQPLPLIAYEFLEQEPGNPDYALRAAIKPYGQTQLGEIWLIMKKRLNARCKDLLEVTFDAETSSRIPYSILCYRVDFLHRSVREFFRKTDNTFETLGKWKPDDFDVELSLCRISIALLKLSQDSIFLFVDEFIHHAQTIETQYSHDPSYKNQVRLEHEFKLLDEMELVNTSFGSSHRHWTNDRRSNISLEVQEGSCNDADLELETFLTLTIQAGLTHYVERRLRSHYIQDKKGRPLLTRLCPATCDTEPSGIA